MLSVVLQCADAWLTLAFGVLAGVIARSVGRSEPVKAGGWWLVALAFGIIGLSSVVQTAFAAAAWRAGPGTGLWEGYLRWATIGNQGRNVVSIALGVVLLAFVRARREVREALLRSAPALLLGALVAGSALGVIEGPLSASHLANIALLDLLALLLLFGALLGDLARHSLDRLLWGALCLYAVRQALAVLWWTGMTWIGLDGAWHPSPAHWQMISVAVWAVMVAVTLWRLRLARRGTPVPALLEPLDGAGRTALARE